MDELISRFRLAVDKPTRRQACQIDELSMQVGLVGKFEERVAQGLITPRSGMKSTKNAVQTCEPQEPLRATADLELETIV